MRRRADAFTLVEAIVTTLLATVVMLGVFGGLTFIGSGYRRDELTMSRHRLATQIFELLGDDLAHASGVAIPTQLSSAGYAGTDESFQREPRLGDHVVHSYAKSSAQLRSVHRSRYREIGQVIGGAYSVDVRRSKFESGGLPKGLSPWGIVSSVFVVPVPADSPDVTFVAISKVKKLEREQVLWAFWHKGRVVRTKLGTELFSAGTVVRSGKDFVRFDSNNQRDPPTRLMASIVLKNEFVHEHGPDDGRLQPVELLLELELTDLHEPLLPFVSPPFLARRTLTAGL